MLSQGEKHTLFQTKVAQIPYPGPFDSPYAETFTIGILILGACKIILST